MASISTLVAGTFDPSNATSYTVTSATYTAGRLYILTVRNRRTAGASESPSSISGGNASNVFSKPTNAVELTYQSTNNYLTTWFMVCAVTETTTRTINFTNQHLNCSFHVAECIGFDTTVLNSLIVQQRELADDGNQNASLAFTGGFANAANFTYAVMDYAATGTAQSITADGNMLELANPEASGVEVGYLHVQYKASEEATVNWTKSNTTVSGMGIMELKIAAVTASITGVAATATAAAPIGSVAALVVASVTGVVATAASAALDGTVAAIGIVSVTGTQATATAAAPIGSVAALVTTSISGEPATTAAEALAGTITAGSSADVTVTGEVATASAAAIEGAVTALAVVSIAGTVATATSAALEGTVAAQVTTSITGEPATASAAAPTGSITAEVTTSITGTVATAASAALVGVITALIGASVNGETATASAVAEAGEVAGTATAGPSRIGGGQLDLFGRGADRIGSHKVDLFGSSPGATQRRSGALPASPLVLPPLT